MASAIKQAPDEVAAQRTATIRIKNDAFRSSFAGGRVMLTQGVNALALAVKGALLNAVQAFDDFSPTNDPHGEHDFGAFSSRAPCSFGRSTTTIRICGTVRLIQPTTL